MQLPSIKRRRKGGPPVLLGAYWGSFKGAWGLISGRLELILMADK